MASPKVPWRSRVADAVVVTAGVGLTLATLLTGLPDAGLPSWWPLLVLAIPVTLLLDKNPLTLARDTLSMEIGLDSVVLVFLALSTERPIAILIWAVATTVVKPLAVRSTATRVFNVGLCLLSGWLAVAVMHLVGDIGQGGFREAVATGAGVIVYFAVDYLLTAVTQALYDGTAVGELLWHDSLPVLLGSFIAVACIGYLGALVFRVAPWALALTAAPLVAVVASTREFDRADKSRRRSQLLFEAAATAHAAHDAEHIRAALVERTKSMVRSVDVGLRPEPPGQEEIGALLRPGDEPLWVVAGPRASGQPFSDGDQTALDMLTAVAAESLSRVRATDELAYLAAHDPLTGLPNRSLFLSEVEAAVAEGAGPVAVLFCDLDGFKGINDSLGHDAGDEVLTAVAGRLAAALRPGDVVARLGGDEFAVLARLSTTDAEAPAIGQRLLRSLTETIPVRGLALRTGCSIGIAVGQGGGQSAAGLLRDSDIAMYAAKAAGRNRYALFTPTMLDRRLHRVGLERELRLALGREQFEVHYQPLVDLTRGTMPGVEALVRWRHPERGLISPVEFIPLAEETGLICDLGEFVLTRAHEQVAALVERLGRPLALNVNVSVGQVTDDRLEELVTRILANPRIPLTLEITESTLATGWREVSRLGRLRELGAKLAIDDFGTGYNSLTTLRHLPVDQLKLDRGFVSDVATDLTASGIARSVVNLARTLGLAMVAEGIETPAQAAALLTMGCELGQGFHFAAPMEAAAVLSLLRTNDLGAITVVQQRGP